MIDHRRIYDCHAEEYDQLVAAEDAAGRLPEALAHLCRLEGARVVEVGVGTGRVTRHLLRLGASVIGCDRAAAMIEVARRRLSEWSPERLVLSVTDAASIEVAAGSCDLAVAGWVFGHFVSWLPGSWREEIGRAIARLEEALLPGGALVFIETLGTGAEQPAPPHAGLAEYYGWLEAQGFVRQAIRTDYAFPSPEEAARLVGFFFGEEMVARLAGRATLPECTGLWIRRRALPLGTTPGA